jgi:hypothetical protein
MVASELLRAALMLLHALAGAAWFGSIFYGAFVLYPRVSRHFDSIAERERLLMALSHGARWHMIAAMSLVGLSGLGLLLMPRSEITWPRLALISVKAGLMIASAILFWRVSWHWWPARLFALEAELPAIHRRFRLGAACMLVLVGLNFAIGMLTRLNETALRDQENHVLVGTSVRYLSRTPFLADQAIRHNG